MVPPLGNESTPKPTGTEDLRDSTLFMFLREAFCTNIGSRLFMRLEEPENTVLCNSAFISLEAFRAVSTDLWSRDKWANAYEKSSRKVLQAEGHMCEVQQITRHTPSR